MLLLSYSALFSLALSIVQHLAMSEANKAKADAQRAEGNRHFMEERFDEAIRRYNEAMVSGWVPCEEEGVVGWLRNSAQNAQLACAAVCVLVAGRRSTRTMQSCIQTDRCATSS